MPKKVKEKTEEKANLPEEKKVLTEHQTRKRIEDILEKRRFDDFFEL
ncbi:hypothetical protein ABWJ26_004235 [Vibrio fluvialis]